MHHHKTLICFTITSLALLSGQAAWGAEEVLNELESWNIRPRSVAIRDDNAPKGYRLLGVGLTLPLDYSNDSQSRKLTLTMYPPVKHFRYQWEMSAPEGVRPVPRITNITYSLDGKPYSQTRFGDFANRYGKMTFDMEAPYVPQSLRLVIQFANSETQALSLRSRQPVLAEPDSDARQDSQNNGYIHNQLLKANKPAKAVALVEFMKDDRFMGFVFRDGCIATQHTGRVIRTRLVMKRHPRYAPEGDLLLHETQYLQPVYRTYEYLFFQPKANFYVYETDPITLNFECQTESGQRLAQVLKAKRVDYGIMYRMPEQIKAKE